MYLQNLVVLDQIAQALLERLQSLLQLAPGLGSIGQIELGVV